MIGGARIADIPWTPPKKYLGVPSTPTVTPEETDRGKRSRDVAADGAEGRASEGVRRRRDFLHPIVASPAGVRYPTERIGLPDDGTPLAALPKK